MTPKEVVSGTPDSFVLIDFPESNEYFVGRIRTIEGTHGLATDLTH